MLTAAAGFGVAMLLLLVSPSRDTAVAAAALVGVASIAFLTTGNGTIQIAAPPEMRGRVTGLWTTAFVGSTPLGAVIVGVVAREFGGRGALAVGMIGCVAALVAGLLVLRRSQRYFASPIDLP
jgi:MFS family permease